MTDPRYTVTCYAIGRPVAPTIEAAGMALADAINFVEHRVGRETWTRFTGWTDDHGALVRETTGYGYRVACN